jgi:hypothetical protein
MGGFALCVITNRIGRTRLWRVAVNFISYNGWVYEKVFYLEISKFILTFCKKLSYTPCYVYVKFNHSKNLIE